MKSPLPLVLALLFLAAPLSAGIQYNATQHTWSLRTGPIEYRLREDGGVVSLSYFGPVGEPAWPASRLAKGRNARFESDGQINGQSLRAENLQLVAQKIVQPTADQAELLLTFQHRHLPLEMAVRYATWGKTGVLTRSVTYTNRGDHPLGLGNVSSLAWLLPPGDYSLNYLHGSHGDERQLETEKLRYGERRFVNKTGRSTNGYSPWFCLRDDQVGLRYAAALAYSGNWEMAFERVTAGRRVPMLGFELEVNLGMRFDAGAPPALQPGASFETPAVAFTASTGDLDDIANQLHRYERQYVIPTTATNDPLITQCNTFISLGRSPKVADLKRYADLAAEIGLESLGTDASWVIKTKEGKSLYGEWIEDPVGFPNGLKELADYVHAKGLKFSVWMEPEAVSKYSPIARQHPEWILKHNGVAMEGSIDRVHLDFRLPEVRAWARAVVDRLVREDQIDWLKIDYNTDVGESFDLSPGGPHGTELYDHLRGLNGWLDSIRVDYPKLMIEGCSSGALRVDLSMIAHTHCNWISDMTNPRPCMQLAYGATLEFPAEIGYHWSDAREGKPGVQADQSSPRGWWDFIFRASMNGMFGVGDAMAEWTPAIKSWATENVKLYKRIRTVIKGSDVYHLTPPPAAGESPTGWMALQYSAPDGARSVVMAYRLGDSVRRETLRLRGLSLERTYLVKIDGIKPARPARSTFTGRELATAGLTVELDAEWRSAVIELSVANAADDS